MSHFDPGHGLANPVFDTQAIFRGLMDALSRPGTPVDLARSGLQPPEGLSAAAAATVLSLADHDTPVWLAGGKTHVAARWLAFHAGAPATSDAGEASFAVINGAAATPLLKDFPAGDERYPDRSATVIVECSGLEGGAPVTLSGPGIRGSVVIAPTGLHAGFWAEIISNAQRYPLGIDLLLAAGSRVIGLPRSTQIGEAR
jgi:alpha-D-ribose 1-methylphosphonate 5-triphosphate synthase subunit PhnH